jgi:hypothetical protein
MKIKVTQRHFVHDEETSNAFDGIISRTIDAQQKKPQIDFAMAVGYKLTTSSDVMEGLTKQLKRLAEKNIKITLGDYGPGDAWLSTMTDVVGLRSFYSDKQISEHPKGCITCLVDGNQFDIDRSEVLDGIDIISRRLIEKNSLLGLGARDKVSLANTRELDDARKIEEMYHAVFMDNIKLDNPLGIDISGAPPSYKVMGDPIPGCYLVNNSSKNYIVWRESLWKDSSDAVLTRQVGLGDTIGVMEASTLEKETPSVYIPVRENPPGAFKKETIKRKSNELARTNIAEGYYNVVENETNKKRLLTYYPEQQVSEVREIILEGLKEGMKTIA